MKNFLALFVATIFCFQIARAQSPQSIPFQAVVRDSNGVLLPSQNILVRVTIHDATSTGTTVYQETDSVMTNTLGLITLNIGQGTSTYAFSAINWGSGPKFVQLELAIGGAAYINMGTSQLQSVPYALYALNSGNTTGWYLNSTGLSETDTTFNVGIGTSMPTYNLTVVGNVAVQQHYSDNNGGSMLTQDSTGLFAIAQADNSSIVSALCVGDGSNLLGPGAPYIAAAVGHDGGYNIFYGLISMPDSALLLTQRKSVGLAGVLGTYDYSSFLDVQYNGLNSLNSLTLDTVGLHYEFMDTDRYTFPNVDGASGQILTTDGSGHLGWTSPSVGRVSVSSQQIAYGTASGISGDANFVHDSATGQTLIITTSQEYTELAVDSDLLFAGHVNSSNTRISILTVGNGNSVGLDTMTFFGGVIARGSNEILYGINATDDSVQMIATDGTSDGGIAGVQYYSSYLDAWYENGNQLNSLTVDTDGLHWEYRSSDLYTFPNTTGTVGQVMSTDGSGHIAWANASGSKAIFTPSSGDNITAVFGSNIINPSSGLSALTITLPSSPGDNQTVYFTFTNTITTITFSGSSVAGPLGTVSSISNGSVKYWLTYDAASSTWY